MTEIDRMRMIGSHGDGQPEYFAQTLIQQTWSALYWLDVLIREHNPRSILEIGMGGGGLTIFFGLYKPGAVVTVDIHDNRFDHVKTMHERLGIKLIVTNAQDPAIAKQLMDSMPRPLLLLCDNGNKPLEFKLYVPHLRKGDAVLVHDNPTEFPADGKDATDIAQEFSLIRWHKDDLDGDKTLLAAWRCARPGEDTSRMRPPISIKSTEGDSHEVRLAKSPEMFIHGPCYKYVVREVPLPALLDYLKRRLGDDCLIPQYVEAAKSFLKDEKIEQGHPYYDYLESSWLTTQADINDMKRLFDSLKARRIMKTPLNVSIHGNKVLGFHGFHRLAVAHVLELETVPVAFSTTDPKIMELASSLFSIYTAEEPRIFPGPHTTLYQPIDSAFFELCRCQNPETPKKAHAIVEAMKDVDGPTVDFGAHLGYYSRALAAAGHEVIAVESDERMAKAQPLLEYLGMRPLCYVHMPFETFINGQGRCNLLALSILHHYSHDELGQRILPWVQKNVDVMVAEFPDDSNEASLKFWRENAGFSSVIEIFRDGFNKRTTSILRK